MLLDTFRKYETRAVEEQQKKKQQLEEQEKKRKEKIKQQREQEEKFFQQNANSQSATVTEITDEEAARLQTEIDRVSSLSCVLALEDEFHY